MKVFWPLILLLGLATCARSSKKAAAASSDEDSDTSEVGYHSDDGDYSAAANDDDLESLSGAMKKTHLYQFLGVPKTQKKSGGSQNPFEFKENTNLACRDAQGRAVDWWFVYKEPRGERFLSYSSYDASMGRTEFSKLDYRASIRSYAHSPLIKTLYQNYKAKDNSVWFAWNNESQDGYDAHGQRIDNTKHAHSKGFFAIKSVPLTEKKAEVSSYAILHSLPRFPVIPKGNALWNGVMRHTFPDNPDFLFDTNFRDNGQHFMCVSFKEEEMEVKNGEIKYTNVLPNGEINTNHPSYVKFLQKYLRIIHPAIIATNFNDVDYCFAIWRQYFSLYSGTFSQAEWYLKNNSTAIQRQAYSAADLPYAGSNYHLNLLFPLSGSRHFLNGGYSQTPVSIWAGPYSSRNGCVNGNEPTCFGEAVITTTNYQFRSSFKLFAKHGASCIDIYDDWATLQLSELQNHFEKSYSKQIPPRHGMLVQSWLDTGALPKKPSKKIYDSNGKIIASVHVDNVGHLQMNAVDDIVCEIQTKSYDHSKWLLGFSLDSFNGDNQANENKAKFMPLFCVGDLNRTNTQAQLKGKNQGRGGGLMCTTNRALWAAMTTLNPQATRPKYANSNKQRAVALQNQLRPFVTSPFQNKEYDKTSLNVYRKRFFKFLRITPDPLNKNKAVDFVSFLNELNQFLIHARMAAEKKAFYAFERFYEMVARGSIIGAAKRIWDKLPDEQEIPENFVPILRKLPSVVLARHEPKSHKYDDMVVMHLPKEDKITLMSEASEEYKDTLLSIFNEEKDVGVQTNFDEIPLLLAQLEDEGENEDDDEEEDEDYVTEEEGSDDDDDFDDDDSQNYIRDYGDLERIHRRFHSASEDENSDSENNSSRDSDRSDEDEEEEEEEEEEDEN